MGNRFRVTKESTVLIRRLLKAHFLKNSKQEYKLDRLNKCTQMTEFWPRCFIEYFHQILSSLVFHLVLFKNHKNTL